MAFVGSKTTFKRGFRMIASRFPPIDLFEDIAEDVADWELLIELEMLTNARVLDQVGDVKLVRVDERVSGVGASIVMAAFTHINLGGSRFSDGTFGVYYAGDSFETALRERIYHLEKHLLASKHFKDDMDQRVYVGDIRGRFLEVLDLGAAELDLTDYSHAQKFALKAKTDGVDGVVFASVRHLGHFNIAAFRAICVDIPKQERHVRLHFDGVRVNKYFDFELEKWVEMGE